MKVLLVDDHNLFRSGLIFLLTDLAESIDFVEAIGVEDAIVKMADPAEVELVLLDLNLHGTSGTEALEKISSLCLNATTVVLSSEEDPHVIRQCISAGAAGFIPKSSTPEVLVTALKLILAGGIYLPPIALESGRGQRTAMVFPANVDAADGGTLTISPRQHEALMLAVRGKSNKVIARELGIAEGTVKLHLSAAFRVLGVSNRTEAVFAAADLGMVSSLRS